MPAFEPFEDFDADAPTLERFAQLLREDPVENLTQRFKYFAQQDPMGAMRHLGFLPNILKHGFTAVLMPETAMVCSIGYWYSFRFPELMLVPAMPSATREKMQAALQAIGDELATRPPVDPDLWRGDPQPFLHARAQELGQLCGRFFPPSGLTAKSLTQAGQAFLEAHPYGYGWYFYRHFADEVSVPLLCAYVS